MTGKAVVFDVGNVLVRWHPHQAWLDDLGSVEAVDAFLSRIDFPARNLRGDGGERFADIAADIDDPHDRHLLATYPDRYHRTISEPVAGTWELLDRLHARGVRTHAITNWSAEHWDTGLRMYPRLGTDFGTVIVSGFERMLKPSAQIFHLLFQRADLQPQDCVFIDDSPVNISAALDVGMDGILFTDATALERALIDRGVL